AYNAMRVTDLPERYKCLREREIDRRRAAGIPLDLAYDDIQELLDPFYRSYRCSDGRQFYLVAASHRRHVAAALELLGIDGSLPARFDPWLPTSEWPDDCTLFAYPMSERWTRELGERIARAFATRTSAEWERLFGAAGVPGAAQRTTREWLASEHAL